MLRAKDIRYSWHPELRSDQQYSKPQIPCIYLVYSVEIHWSCLFCHKRLSSPVTVVKVCPERTRPILKCWQRKFLCQLCPGQYRAALCLLRTSKGTKKRSRPGLREASLVGTIRNEAEVIEALQKVISKAFTKKATGPNCGLNVRVECMGWVTPALKRKNASDWQVF